jgi:hypothetical protein
MHQHILSDYVNQQVPDLEDKTQILKLIFPFHFAVTTLSSSPSCTNVYH